MRDPYLYGDAPVLKNLLNIRDAAALERAEADITSIRLLAADGAAFPPAFDLPRLLAVHKHIFGDVYEWAGSVRTVPMVKSERVLGGDTVRYSRPDDIERDCAAVMKKLAEVDWPAMDAGETAGVFAKLIAAL